MMCTPGARSRHLAPKFPGARCFVAGDMKVGVSLKRAFKVQFKNAYFRSLVHSSQKLWSKLVEATLLDVFCM